MLGTAYDDIRLDTHSLKLFDTGLGRLGLELAGCLDVRNQSYMTENGILMSNFMLELADCLKERLTFNVSDRSTYFYNCDMHIIRCKIAIKTALDLIGDMRNHLNRSAAVITAAFFLEYRPVYLTGSDVGILCQAFVDKTLIVSQIQICLSTVIGYENFSVLDWIHGTRVNVDVWIEFLHGNLVSPGLEQTSEGCGCNTFSKAGYDTSGDKDVFYWHNSPPVICSLVL